MQHATGTRHGMWKKAPHNRRCSLKRPYGVIPNEFVVPMRIQLQRIVPFWLCRIRWLVLRGSKHPILAIYRHVTSFVNDENPLKVMILGEDTVVRAVGERELILNSSRVRCNDTWVLKFESSKHRMRMYELVKLWIELATFLQNLTNFQSISKTNNSVVYTCYDLRNPNSRFALKRINAVKFRNEIEVTQRIMSIEPLRPYIPRYFFTFCDGRESSVTMVMKNYTGGSLADRIREFGPLSEASIRMVLAGLCNALCLLHQHNILHLDVKASNILFDCDVPYTFANLKLVDFGSSVYLGRHAWQQQQRGRGRRRPHPRSYYRIPSGMLPHEGTYGCMAPERFEGRCGREADVYGVGIVLYQMVVGSIPFWGEDAIQIMTKNMEGNVVFDPTKWKRVSKSLKHLTERMLDKNPDKRITFREIFELEWLWGPPMPGSHPHLVQASTPATGASTATDMSSGVYY